jgi:hypothetical protein
VLGWLLPRAVGLALVLLAPVLLIRAQPYDDGGLADLLGLEPGCRCILGLTLDVTSLENAERMVRDRPTSRYQVRGSPVGISQIDWFEESGRFNGTITLTDGRVSAVDLHGVQLYELWFLLGEPAGGRLLLGEANVTDAGRLFHLPTEHVNQYPQMTLQISARATCQSFWEQRVDMTLAVVPIVYLEKAGFKLGQHRQTICGRQREYARMRTVP